MVLKSFDFFRKIQTDQELTSATGGLFTVFSLLIGSILIIMSFQDFYSQRYYTFLAVKNDDSTYLPLRIDITLNKIPCNAITIQFHDQLEYLQQNLQQKLEMYQFNQDGKQSVKYFRDQDIQKQKKYFIEAVHAKKYCRIAGILNVPKTPGTLSIRPTAGNLIQLAGFEIKNAIRLSYKVKQLDFGLSSNNFEFPIAHKSSKIANYIKQLEGGVLLRQYVQDFSNQQSRVSFYNHIKIIPVTIQHSKQLIESGDKYRYSLRSGKGPMFSEYPQIQFYTEIQPINIVYKKQDASLYDLIVKILAVVGGSVASIGILNSLAHCLFGIK